MTALSEFPRKPIRTLKAHAGPVYCVKYTSDGKWFFSSSGDRLVKLWNGESGELIKEYEGHGKDVLGVALPKEKKDAYMFASCSKDNSVVLWDILTGRIIRRFNGHHYRVNDIDMNLGSSVIASASYDSTVKLWDCKSQSRVPIQTLSDSKDSIECVLIIGHKILTGSVDGMVRQYDIRMGEVISDNVGFPITSIDLAKNKKCLLVSSTDSKIRIFDLDTGEMLNEYSGHINTNYRTQSRYLMDEKCVISGSEDGKLYVWDIISAKLLFSLDAHQCSVNAISNNPTNSTSILSSDVSGKIGIWRWSET